MRLKRPICPGFLPAFFTLLLLFFPRLSFAFADWQQSTPEELKMTSDPAAPGAVAVYLYREETTDDTIAMHSYYVRLKILTEEGKKFGDVELTPFDGRSFSVTDIAGRTIHPDGTVIPFTGKPYEKLLEKDKDHKYMTKVFTLPDVQVGSILEYRYKLRYDDNAVVSARWYIQSGLYTHKAHYRFLPFTSGSKYITVAHGMIANGVAYVVSLPPGTEIKRLREAFELDVANIPPTPKEEYLPPLSSFTYRVLFYYAAYRTEEEFWKSEGKFWSKDIDKFANPGKEVKAAVSQLVAPGDTEEQKLQKLYLAVQHMENTDLTFARSHADERASGLRDIKDSDDILQRKRGSSDQLTLLFIALARAAGFKAYAMTVVNRDRSIFTSHYLEMSQFDDDLAVVEVGGKTVFLDPGSKYCKYGQLHWKHTLAGGLRQTANGTGFADTPGLSYQDSLTMRNATLTMTDEGEVAGKVRLVYMGQPALSLRQEEAGKDFDGATKDFEELLKDLLPGGIKVHVVNISSRENGELPLVLDYTISGPLGVGASKRLLLTSQLFEINRKQLFTAEKRENPVYFHHPYRTVDSVELTVPATLKVDSLPKSDTFKVGELAYYHSAFSAEGNKLKLGRDFALAGIVEPATDYPKLRDFFGKVKTEDEGQAILKRDAGGTQ